MNISYLYYFYNAVAKLSIICDGSTLFETKMTEKDLELAKELGTAIQKITGHTSTIKKVERNFISLNNNGMPFLIHLYPDDTPRRSIPQNSECIHIDTYNLVHQGNKILARIKALSGYAHKIHGRKTKVKKIANPIAYTFQVENHLFKPLMGKHSYGLYLEDKLISVAVFSNARNMKQIRDGHKSYELLRFCHQKDHLVVGGLSKLLNSFIKDYQPDDIMTYIDRDWTSHSKLHHIGFVEKANIEEQAFWVLGPNRNPINKNELKELLTKQNKQGFLKYNLGSIKMILKLGK